MKLPCRAVFMLAAFGTASLAQATDFQGKWTSQLISKSGKDQVIELVLNESDGTWLMVPQTGKSGKSDPCVGKEFPVAVVSQSSPDIVLEINGSKVIAGCINQGASLKLMDGKTLEGSLKDGRALKFVRQ